MVLKGNPNPKNDWAQVKSKRGGKGNANGKYSYTIAHWAATEARFRRHLKKIKDTEGLEPLEDLILRLTQDDITHRRFLIEGHHAYVPDFGSFIEVEDDGGKVRTLACSRQLVLFCVERRRAWRMLQSRAGVKNIDYAAQRTMLARVKSGDLAQVEFVARTRAIFDEELKALAPAKPKRSGPGVKEEVAAK